MEAEKKKNLFEVFENIPIPKPYTANHAATARTEPTFKEYHVNSEKAEAVSFSFSPDNPTPPPNPAQKGEPQAVKDTVYGTASTAINTSVKRDNKEVFENMPTSKPVFNSLVDEAENITSLSLALEEMLTKEQNQWRGTAHILSTLLHEHVCRLKEINA